MTLAHARDAAFEPSVALRFARYWWIAGWMLVAFITVSCLEPPRYVPDLHVSDKLEHAGAFFCLTLWFGGLVRRQRYPLLGLWMLLFGAGIELAQGVMGWGRDMDFWDFAADAIGVAVASGGLYVGLGMWTWQIERILGLSCEPS
ncbi:MAG TPA: hypothetical protein VMG11_01980 [Steroidobacteraceae bacterium]|nr:hypothetical protein [Steroidobacteraceae bacterium]